MLSNLRHVVLVFAITALLYGAGLARASEPPPAAPTPDNPVPHIALLLPTQTDAFGRHAEAVRDGILSASKQRGASLLPLRLYALTSTELAAEGYRQAVASGARAVIGPLTRNAVAALATYGQLPVPTLALNSIDGLKALPQLYSLSLQVEPEAQQIAAIAWADGRRRAVVIHDESVLGRRMQQAFAARYTSVGGEITDEFVYATNPEVLVRLRQALAGDRTDMVFLALNAAQAKNIKGYLGALPVYATSQVHLINPDPLTAQELGGVRFVDMPWLLEPEHTAVMVYPRPDYSALRELERFYALGIDAYRAVLELLDRHTGIAIDGVTGQLTLQGQTFNRTLLAAEYRDGRVVRVVEAKP